MLPGTRGLRDLSIIATHTEAFKLSLRVAGVNQDRAVHPHTAISRSPQD